VDQHRFNADPDLTFHFDADPDPDPTPSFTHVRKSELIFFTFDHRIANLYFFYLPRQRHTH
jgi:hypothetical protein